ncbi:LysE family transporter [Amycolatopsis sp. NPDC049691]|uniref:LysE family translocator n=1 Tax=Amycolatopsis sp. NPDC049691 TaxID=3155155 RepID=UPI00341B43DD
MNAAATLGTVLLAYLPAAISPGPNFLLIAHTAAAGTRRAAVAVALGVVAAGGVLAAVAVFGLGSVLARTPWLATALRVLCGGYLAWLGVRLWWRAPALATGSGAQDDPLADSRRGRPREQDNPLPDDNRSRPGEQDDPLADDRRGRPGAQDDPLPDDNRDRPGDLEPEAPPAHPRAAEPANTLPDQPGGRERVAHFRRGVVSNLTNPKAAAFFGSVLTAALPPTEPTAVKAAAVALIVVASTAWHLSVALLFSSPATRRWYARAKPALDRVVGTILVALGATLAVTP